MSFYKIKNFTPLLFLFFLVVPFSINAQEAELFLTPSSGTYQVGSRINVDVRADTGGADINAVETELNFNPQFLQVREVSKGPHINLWVVEPTYDNQTGSVTFSGGTPQEFSGSSKTLISVTFKAERSGKAEVSFISGTATKADGMGTDILGNMEGGIYNLVEPDPEPDPPVVVDLPNAPVISSASHPDSDKWCADNSPRFEWNVPERVTAVRLSISREKVVPTVLYEPPISERQLEDLADGVWHFSAQFRNEAGWGQVSHFGVQIDTEPPEYFTITEIPREDLTESRASFEFDAEDETSGISHYEIWINDERQDDRQDDETGVYVTPHLGPGEYELRAHAVDFAGNYAEEEATFDIDPVATPEIVSYPDKLTTEERPTFAGITEPFRKIEIWTQEEGEEPVVKAVKADGRGEFELVHPDLFEVGHYKVWAVAENEGEVRSEKSEAIEMRVASPYVFYIGEVAIHYAVMVLIILLVALILLILWWKRRKREKVSDPDLEARIGKEIKRLDEKIESEKKARKDLKKLLKSVKNYSSRKNRTEEGKKRTREEKMKEKKEILTKLREIESELETEFGEIEEGSKEIKKEKDKFSIDRREINKLEDETEEITRQKKVLEAKKEDILQKERKAREALREVIENFKEIKREKTGIEDEEKAILDSKGKRRVAKRRWDLEEKRRQWEQKERKARERIEEILRKKRKVKRDYQEIMSKAKDLKKKVKALE